MHVYIRLVKYCVMCTHNHQLTFSLVDNRELEAITKWILARLDQGFDLHLSRSKPGEIFICVPMDSWDLIEQFLLEWGPWVSAVVRPYKYY